MPITFAIVGIRDKLSFYSFIPRLSYDPLCPFGVFVTLDRENRLFVVGNVYIVNSVGTN